VFDAILSADAVNAFKTHPKVYQYPLDSLVLPAAAISFQSFNAWDAHRASAFSMRVVWCNRYGQRRERLPGRPTRAPDALGAAGAAGEQSRARFPLAFGPPNARRVR
jgi:2-haloacid dehalogenase